MNKYSQRVEAIHPIFTTNSTFFYSRKIRLSVYKQERIGSRNPSKHKHAIIVEDAVLNKKRLVELRFFCHIRILILLHPFHILTWLYYYRARMFYPSQYYTQLLTQIFCLIWLYYLLSDIETRTRSVSIVCTTSIY